MEKIEIKPSGNKSRFGRRGPKQRYAVYKAKWNQAYLPVEEKQTRELCEKHNLIAEDFLDENDNPNRKWSYALIRAMRLVHNPNYPNISLIKPGTSFFYRY